MSIRRTSVSENLAMKAAAAAARQAEPEDDEPTPAIAVAEALVVVSTSSDEALPAPRRGRPRGKRPVEARQTIYLDKARHDALTRIAVDRGRSVHSLIIEGVDQVIGKPVKAGWQ
jgi:hypothetical protein